MSFFGRIYKIGVKNLTSLFMNKKGFTLIELLIVIAIIGILAVAFLPSLLGAPQKARDTQRVSAVQKIATVLSAMSLEGNLPTTSACSDEVAGFDAADFGGQIPVDPVTGVITYAAGKTCGAADANGGYYGEIDPNDAGTTVDAGTYSFAVIAQLETPDNANTTCGNAVIGVLDTTGADWTSDEPCFAVLVQ